MKENIFTTLRRHISPLHFLLWGYNSEVECSLRKLVYNAVFAKRPGFDSLCLHMMAAKSHKMEPFLSSRTRQAARA